MRIRRQKVMREKACKVDLLIKRIYETQNESSLKFLLCLLMIQQKQTCAWTCVKHVCAHISVHVHMHLHLCARPCAHACACMCILVLAPLKDGAWRRSTRVRCCSIHIMRTTHHKHTWYWLCPVEYWGHNHTVLPLNVSLAKRKKNTRGMRCENGKNNNRK